jgi:cytochrome d ubiquinol oxidase subunit II
VSIEFRSHLRDRMWRSFWDATFWLASTLAPVFLGAALGNLVRGVPLGQDGWFALPLFASFSPFGALGLLDWYTILIALLAWAAILHHGALFLAWKTDGPLRARALVRAAWLLPLTGALWVASTIATAVVAPHVFAAASARPAAWFSAAAFVAGFVVSGVARRRGRDLVAFVGSTAFLLGLLAATAASLHPVLLRSSLDPAWSLTIANSAANERSLRLGLVWWPFGFALALVYLAVLFRIHRGKAQAAADGEGY